LAEPGGIVLSRIVRDSIRDRMEIALADMGEVEVKNIARSVRVFRVQGEGEVASMPEHRNALWTKYATAIVVVLAVVVGGGVWWWQQRTDFEPVNPAKMAFPLPDKPSIAVLPFVNSGRLVFRSAVRCRAKP
jgi:adenylate cyclase